MLLSNQFARDPAKDEFQRPRAAVAADDEQIRLVIGGKRLERTGNASVCGTDGMDFDPQPVPAEMPGDMGARDRLRGFITVKRIDHHDIHARIGFDKRQENARGPERFDRGIPSQDRVIDRPGDPVGRHDEDGDTGEQQRFGEMPPERIVPPAIGARDKDDVGIGTFDLRHARQDVRRFEQPMDSDSHGRILDVPAHGNQPSGAQVLSHGQCHRIAHGLGRCREGDILGRDNDREAGVVPRGVSDALVDGAERGRVAIDDQQDILDERWVGHGPTMAFQIAPIIP